MLEKIKNNKSDMLIISWYLKIQHSQKHFKYFIFLLV
jgi:hypothetical protein